MKLAKTTFDAFAKALSGKITKENHCWITEGLIRKEFADFLETSNNEHFQPEIPYKRIHAFPGLPKVKSRGTRLDCAECDSFRIEKDEDITKMFDVINSIEFKYGKATPFSESCSTTNFGSIFNDFNRLSTIESGEKYLIYVFDEEMKNYFNRVIKIKHACPQFAIFYSALAKETKITIDGKLDHIAKGMKEFRKSAFSSFDSPVAFANFHGYQIEQLTYSMINVYANIIVFKITNL